MKIEIDDSAVTIKVLAFYEIQQMLQSVTKFGAADTRRSERARERPAAD